MSERETIIVDLGPNADPRFVERPGCEIEPDWWPGAFGCQDCTSRAHSATCVTVRLCEKHSAEAMAAVKPRSAAELVKDMKAQIARMRGQ